MFFLIKPSFMYISFMYLAEFKALAIAVTVSFSLTGTNFYEKNIEITKTSYYFF